MVCILEGDFSPSWVTVHRLCSQHSCRVTLLRCQRSSKGRVRSACPVGLNIEESFWKDTEDGPKQKQ